MKSISGTHGLDYVYFIWLVYTTLVVQYDLEFVEFTSLLIKKMVKKDKERKRIHRTKEMLTITTSSISVYTCNIEDILDWINNLKYSLEPMGISQVGRQENCVSNI